MKKHSLIEHWEDVTQWYYDTVLMRSGSYNPEPHEDRIWFTAYERWLNDRDLLTEEDKVAEHVA